MAKSQPPGISRREFLGGSLAAAAAGLIVPPAAPSPCALHPAQGEATGAPADIGSRLELFVDDFLMGRLAGGARLELHHPEPREIALVHDAPWEGSGSGYHSVFRDGDLYRMYYKAWHLDVRAPGTVDENSHPLYCCYAESDDGIHWRKPDLGLFEFRGSKKNNIAMAPGRIGAADPDPGHPAVFKDDNPDAPADARYKAIVRSKNPAGLLPLKSRRRSPLVADERDARDHRRRLRFAEPGLLGPGAGRIPGLLALFSPTASAAGEGRKPGGVRAIRTATSRDFLHWGPGRTCRYVDSPPEQLYTNQVKPYYRAPHILIGFPTRYIERGWSDSMRALPGARAPRSGVPGRACATARP